VTFFLSSLLRHEENNQKIKKEKYQGIYMLNEFSRTETLIGKIALNKLSNSKIAIFGIGGVGSSAILYSSFLGCFKVIAVDIPSGMDANSGSGLCISRRESWFDES